MAFDMRLLRRALSESRVIFRVHAMQRMFSRAISENDLFEALDAAEVIEDYPNDAPYPSALLLGFSLEQRPIHAVCALDETDRLILITVYEPDARRWEPDWKTRRKER